MIEADHVPAIRRFSRFYTRAIGVLDEGYFSPAFSLTEGRVLFELGARAPATASELVRDLAIDPGYLSRILMSFETRGYVDRRASARTGARANLAHSGRPGRFETLDRHSSEGVATLIGPSTARRGTASPSHGGDRSPARPRGRPRPRSTLRPHRPATWAGWSSVMARSMRRSRAGASVRGDGCRDRGPFLDRFDPAAERCWIAERDGVRVGCVFLVRESEETAKLRLLLVDPAARGLGLGRRLVAECIAFAREKGYRRLTLWTQSCLVAARRLYADAGFRLVRSEPYRGLGPDLVSETWELELKQGALRLRRLSYPRRRPRTP